MDHKIAGGGSNSPSLLSVPVEVLLQITSDLTTPDLGHLRRTCKQIETTLFPSFSREFFTKRQFMFTEFSLQALVDISKSRLSSCLNHIIFSLQRPLPCSAILAPQPGRDELVKSNRMLEESIAFMTFINTGQDVEMLAEAFSNLVNIETIGLRDFNSRSRHRDYPNIEWRSYGIRTYELNTGASLDYSPHFSHVVSAAMPEDAIYLSRNFLNILRVLGKSQSQLRRFEVILRNRSLHDHAFNLPKYVEPLVDPILANLRTLFLDLSSEFNFYQVGVNHVPTACTSNLLRRFLSKLHKLEHLRLNFRLYESQGTSEILTWLSNPVPSVPPPISSGAPIFHATPEPINLSRLQQLDIGMTAVEPQVLLALIQKYGATLRTISFHKVSLLEATMLEPENRINLWAKFFNQLSKLDLKLSAINLSFLSQGPAGARPIRHVTFTDSPQPRLRSWAGPDMQSGLRDFINYTSVDGLKDGSENSEDSGSNSGDSDSKCLNANLQFHSAGRALRTLPISRMLIPR